MRIADANIRRLIRLALAEDIGKKDITSEALVGKNLSGRAVIVARQNGVLAGLSVAQEVFQTVNRRVSFKMLKQDGQSAKRGQRIAVIQGKVRDILAAERTALNLLQSLSGIATLTAQYVTRVKGTKVRILDTRKTTPGLRVSEKQAVRAGGGENHRMGLFDMFLIKENHIKAAGGIAEAVRKAKLKRRKEKIEVEVRSLREIEEAIKAKPDWIMLDNMNVERMKKAVKMIRWRSPRIKIEASGNVNLNNVRKMALTGVDFVSIGALTHSAPAMDLSLILMEP
jgi:nicotinate-nucleotide pyrophosphorylase (carboxylating)